MKGRRYFLFRKYIFAKSVQIANICVYLIRNYCYETINRLTTKNSSATARLLVKVMLVIKTSNVLNMF